MKMPRSLQGIWYKISGFQPEEIDDIVYRKKAVKEIDRTRKARKRTEKRLINESKFQPCGSTPKGNKKTKQQKVTEQIDRGFEVARRLNNE